MKHTSIAIVLLLADGNCHAQMQQQKPPGSETMTQPSAKGSLNQTIINSPGSVQAGGNVYIAGKLDRILSRDIQITITKALSPYAGIVVDVVSMAGNPEGTHLAGQIAYALKEAGLPFAMATALNPGRTGKGIHVEVKNGATEAEESMAKRLVESLTPSNFAIYGPDRYVPPPMSVMTNTAVGAKIILTVWPN